MFKKFAKPETNFHLPFCSSRSALYQEYNVCTECLFVQTHYQYGRHTTLYPLPSITLASCQARWDLWERVMATGNINSACIYPYQAIGCRTGIFNFMNNKNYLLQF